MSRMRSLALKLGQSCFFNSYIRDVQPPFDSVESAFMVQLNDGTLKVPVTRFSRVGVHEYGAMDFEPAAQQICLSAEAPQLAKRITQSLHNTELSLAEREDDLRALYQGEVDFLSAEQGLLAGHNFHPCPKSKDEFSDEDLKNFSPEMAASFKLQWLFVSRSIVWEERSQTFGATNWQSSVFRGTVPAGLVAYPMHPWQWNVLRQDALIQNYLAQGLIREAGLSENEWSATSSMRSLYNADASYMLKFSMSVRLTNSLRHLQSTEAKRGMQVQDAFHTTAGREFSGRFPSFNVIHEPCLLAIKDQAGQPLSSTMVLVRENPFRGEAKDLAVLATLTQDNPYGGDSLIRTCLKQGHTAEAWFSAFVDHAFIPLMVAQADYGIMLGAHQQNLILRLRNGLPVGAYFRDCQGTGFSQLGVERLSAEMPSTKEFLLHVVPANPSIALFTYYLVVNTVLNTVAAVAKAGGISEATLLRMLRERLERLSVEVRDPSVILHLLNSPTWGQKGNFRCGVESLNENTTTDPLSIYNSIPNPLLSETV